MLGDEGDGGHDQRFPLGAGACDLPVGVGPDPFERPDPALVADDMLQVLAAERPAERGGAALDLRPVRVPGLDEGLGHAVRGIENSRLRTFPVFEDFRDVPGGGLDESGLLRIAANRRRRRVERPAGGARPVAQRGRGGGGRELRVERQQHDPRGIETRDLGHDRVRHRVPVPHADERPEPGIRQFAFERAGLRLGLLHEAASARRGVGRCVAPRVRAARKSGGRVPTARAGAGGLSPGR